MTPPTQHQALSDIAVKPTFRLIDGVAVRFVESEAETLGRTVADTPTTNMLRS